VLAITRSDNSAPYGASRYGVIMLAFLNLTFSIFCSIVPHELPNHGSYNAARY